MSVNPEEPFWEIRMRILLISGDVEIGLRHKESCQVTMILSLITVMLGAGKAQG